MRPSASRVAMRALARLWSPIGQVLSAIDNALVCCAWPQGVEVADPLRRYAQFLVFNNVVILIGVYAPPAIAVIALAVGLIGVVGVSRAWAANEYRRLEIAKKVRHEQADSLPDLRWFAVFSSLLLLVFLPLLCERLHVWQNLFVAEPDATFGNWVWFIVDKTYLRALPEWEFLKGARATAVKYSDPSSDAERAALTVAWAFLYYILVQGAFREWQIWRDLGSAVAAVEADPDLAVRHGRRVIRSLLWRLEEPTATARERVSILEALGQLHAARGFEQVRELAAHTAEEEDEVEVRVAATLALGRLGVSETLPELARLFRSTEPRVRAAVATALGEFPGEGAVRLLRAKLRQMRKDGPAGEEPDANVRGQVVLALGKAAERGDLKAEEAETVLDLILLGPSLLEDLYLRVRSRSATALGRMGNVRCVRPLVQLVETTPNPRLLRRVVPALTQAVQTAGNSELRGEAVAVLVALLEKQPNDDIQIVAARALGELTAREASDTLLRALRRALRWEHKSVADAALKALRQFGGAEAGLAEEIRGTHSQWRSRGLLNVVMNGELPEEKRCEAADRLGEGDGVYAEVVLQRLYQDTTTPRLLRVKVLQALERMNPELGRQLRGNG